MKNTTFANYINVNYGLSFQKIFHPYGVCKVNGILVSTNI